jgi:hypothetical protein
MLSSGKNQIVIAWNEDRIKQAAAVEIAKTFICGLSDAFHNTFYERPLGGDGISIRAHRIHMQN